MRMVALRIDPELSHELYCRLIAEGVPVTFGPRGVDGDVLLVPKKDFACARALAGVPVNKVGRGVLSGRPGLVPLQPPGVGHWGGFGDLSAWAAGPRPGRPAPRPQSSFS